MPTKYKVECREYGDDSLHYKCGTLEEAEWKALDFHRDHLPAFFAHQRANGGCESLEALNLWLVELDIGYLIISKQTFIYLILLEGRLGSEAQVTIAYSGSEAEEKVFEFFEDLLPEYIASTGDNNRDIGTFESFLSRNCYGEFRIMWQPIYVDLLEGGE